MVQLRPFAKSAVLSLPASPAPRHEFTLAFGQPHEKSARFHQVESGLAFDDGRELVVGRNTLELGRVLFSLVYVYGVDLVRKAQFLQSNRDLAAIWGRLGVLVEYVAASRLR